jgi:hypothetical protein
MVSSEDVIRRLSDRCDRLQAWLDDMPNPHKPGCAVNMTYVCDFSMPPPVCDCGYDALIGESLVGSDRGRVK